MNKDTFQKTLEAEYTDLFANDPEYAFVAQRLTPLGLAVKMTNSLATGDADKEDEGVRRTCKKLKIKHTYKAIAEYLGG